MAENDIYNSESKYEKFKANLDKYLEPPSDKKNSFFNKNRKYWIKNPENLKYFRQLFRRFEADYSQ